MLGTFSTGRDHPLEGWVQVAGERGRKRRRYLAVLLQPGRERTGGARHHLLPPLEGWVQVARERYGR